jgi:hypothetical protein
MKRRSIILMACAGLAVFAVVSEVASAAMTLPTFSGSATAVMGSGGMTKLTVLGGATIKCSKVTASGTLTTRNEGTGTVTYSECGQGGEPCNGLADSSGTVLATGEFALVLGTHAGVDMHYLLFSGASSGLHIECPKAAVKLLLVTGALVGLIAQMTGSTTKFSLKVTASEAAQQEYSEYENNGGTSVRLSLKTSQEGGKEKISSVNTEENVLEFGSATSIEN